MFTTAISTDPDLIIVSCTQNTPTSGGLLAIQPFNSSITAVDPVSGAKTIMPLDMISINAGPMLREMLEWYKSHKKDMELIQKHPALIAAKQELDVLVELVKSHE